MAKSKLTVRQKKFADAYIKTGNATQSAITAGYSKKTAGRIASENLKKGYLMDYIQSKTDKIEVEDKVDLERAIQMLSDIANGKPVKSLSKMTNNKNGKVTKDITYEFSPDFDQRLKALEHLVKINGGFIEKREITADISAVKIVDDVPKGSG